MTYFIFIFIYEKREKISKIRNLKAERNPVYLPSSL